MQIIKLSMAAVIFCSSAYATETVNLGDVTVSASKIEQSTLEAPANVTVITSDDLDKTKNQRVGDALIAKVPGLYLRGGAMGSNKPGVTSNWSMRGQTNKIAVFVDGMNMADAYSGAINWSMISMEDVEQIEVVPGASSALYGSNAIGGVITITTKAPKKEEMSFNMGKGFGDSSGEYANALYRNKFDNGLGLVFGVSQNNRDGYISDYVTKTPSGTPAGGAIVADGAILTTTTKGVPTYIVGDLGNNASKQKNVHAKLYYDVTPTAKINGGFAYSDNKNWYGDYHSYLTNAATGEAIPVPVAPTAATNLSLDGKKTTLAESNFYGNSPGSTALRYFAGYEDTLFSDIKLNINAGVIDRDYWYSTAGASTTSAPVTMTSGKGTLVNTPNVTTNASAQLSTPIGENQFLVAGLSTEIGKVNNKKYALTNWSDVDSKTNIIDRMDAKTTTNSLFAQDQIQIGEKFTVYIGGRYDRWTAGGSAAVVTPVAPAVASATEFSDRTENSFTPKLAVVYMLKDNLSIKSSIGTSFNAPNSIDLFANTNWSGEVAPAVSKLTSSNPDLKPEKARSFDLGIEYSFNQGGNFKAAYYITETKNLIYTKDTTVTPFVDPVSNQTINTISSKENAGTALAQGIELSGEYPLSDWFSVNGSYAYTDATITKDDTNTGMEGKRVTNIPKHLVYLALEAKAGDWSGVLSGRYVGEQFSSNDNSDVVKGVWAGYSKYTVANLKVDYKINKNVKASMMIDNLLDEEYYEYYRMPGRSATIQLSANF